MICDLCGEEAENYDWRSNSYNVNETEVSVRIKQKEGENCPPDGGGWGTEIKVDICPDCFKSKLVPWLKSQGVEIKEKDWDW